MRRNFLVFKDCFAGKFDLSLSFRDLIMFILKQGDAVKL